MSKIVFFKGRIRRVSGEKYVSIYVFAEHGGKELSKHVGKEVQGLLVIQDDSI